LQKRKNPLLRGGSRLSVGRKRFLNSKGGRAKLNLIVGKEKHMLPREVLTGGEKSTSIAKNKTK